MSSEQTLSQAVAGALRAEMARQRRTSIELAACLGVSQATAARRTNGETPLDLDEIETIAAWLDVPVAALLADAAAA